MSGAFGVSAIASDLIGRRCVIVKYGSERITDRGVVRALVYGPGSYGIGAFAFLIEVDADSPNESRMTRPEIVGFRPMRQVGMFDEDQQVQIETAPAPAQGTPP